MNVDDYEVLGLASGRFLVLRFIELLVVVFVMAHLRLEVLEVLSLRGINTAVRTTIGTIRLFEVSSLCV